MRRAGGGLGPDGLLLDDTHLIACARKGGGVKPFTKFDAATVSGRERDKLPQGKRKSGSASSVTGLIDDFSGSAGSINNRTPLGKGSQWSLVNQSVTVNGSGLAVAAGADAMAVSDCRAADGVITLTMTVHATNAGGIVFRYQDNSNYWRVQIAATSVKIMEVTNGTTTQRATATGIQTTGTLILTLSGNNISCAGTLVNGAPATFTSSVGASRTKHGLYFGASGPTMDAISMP